MTYLFDSSAWLIHLLNEEGCEQINEIFSSPKARHVISALSLVEIQARLKALGQASQWGLVWSRYRPMFDAVLSVDETISLRAIDLRSEMPVRLPSLDALIAATAIIHDAVLVHRDPHFNAIPLGRIRFIRLPDRGG